MSGRSRASLGFRAWDLGVDSRVERYRSIEGLDRYQDRVSNDASLSDGRTTARVWTSLRPARSYAEFLVALERIRRHGRLADPATPL